MIITINLIVKLPDTPGSLVELIKPISNHGGNIFGILHHHDKKVNNLIPVEISFEINEEVRDVNLKKIQNELKEKNIIIENVTLGANKRHFVAIVTGHVFDTDIVDTLKRLASKDIKVSELQAKFTELSEVSNVKLKLDYPEKMTENELIKELTKICDQKKLFLIRM